MNRFEKFIPALACRLSLVDLRPKRASECNVLVADLLEGK